MTPRWPRQARRASWLARARQAKLRTRVLAGVLLVTLVALVGFDIAALTALRSYLMDQTDTQLSEVLAEYRVIKFPSGRTLPRSSSTPCSASCSSGQTRASSPTPPQLRSAIAGPTANLPGELGKFHVTIVSRGKQGVFVGGNPRLIPRLPPDLVGLAESQQPVTVTSLDGKSQLRLMAQNYPGNGIAYATTSLDQVDTTAGQLEIILIIGSAAAGLLSAAGAAWVVRRGLHPVEAMAGQADAITAGDLTTRVSPDDRGTEVGRLGAALNGMLARIGEFIADREASQDATRRFFADASHELRTPLASLRANAELYQQGALTGRRSVDEAMRRITLEAKRMTGLVDDMLRLARLDQPGARPPGQRYDTVDLTAVVARCTDRARTADPLRTWHASICPGLVVTGDEELLGRAVDNLLANVTVHTPEGTAATITAAADADRVIVEVTDDGPGVPEAQLARIFDRFYRVAGRRRGPGSGLGLAIVSAVADSHQGSVGAQLAPPHGLRVILTLPAAL
jgi:two-component system, OmpR family, sensor kinase